MPFSCRLIQHRDPAPDRRPGPDTGLVAARPGGAARPPRANAHLSTRHEHGHEKKDAAHLRVSRAKWRGVSQLRLQARGRHLRSGLAGRSLPRKQAFGPALHRADGDRHYAGGRPCPSPRGGLRTDTLRPLNQRRYWDKRERERERCVSSADASTYGPYWPRGDSRHVCPARTHAKTAPSPKRFRFPLPKRTPADQ
jgi:hypothetical protein